MDTIILHLSLIEQVGPSIIQRLIDRIIDRTDEADQADWYHFSQVDFMNRYGLPAQAAERIVKGLADRRLLEQEFELLEKHPAIQWMSVRDPRYPPLLKAIHLPPPVLYWRGTLPQGDQLLAVVGSRNASSYAQEAIISLIAPLAREGWTIVSGGALGVDTMAHACAVDNQGKTVAVLGSGLLNLYPPQNLKLFETIVTTGGALVSPFPLLMEPLPGNFPARNRVISGMSRGCVVVQAALKSGARITANYCLTQGREVFAVPGPFYDSLSAGCHALIQQGAKLVTCPADIVAEFGQEMPLAPLDEKPQILPIFAQEEGDPLEQAVIKACRAPSSIDELLDATGISLIEMTHLLFNLQIKGRIAQNMAGLWEKP